MLPRPQRLHTQRHFTTVWRRGRARRGKLLTIRLAPTDRDAQPRFGFVVSKAAAKRANVRNLVKRRLRHLVKDLRLPAADIVIYANQAATTATYAELQAELQNLLTFRHAPPHR